MPYVIICTDRPGSQELRNATRPEHLQYLTDHAHLLLAAGARIDDDGSGGHGGVLIVDAEDRKVAEDFIANDPFTKAGLFESVTVERWRKAFFDKQRLV